ncbi:MAG TPA: archease [Candidatus Omnitrophota bacterium]|nr:archease [Candidatus Omnitrophota bacterium]HOX10180.1 archease [Candidatus Omnitrophota bacterium]HPN66169.1 archease [Candidatus Omnitrophota bacterium]
MPYEYLEHEADIGLRAWDRTLEKAFAAGGKALFDIMVDIKKVKKASSVDISCEARDIPALFVEWLNKLLTEADIKKMVFKDFKIRSIEPFGYDLYRLKGVASGEKLDPKRHMIKTEAKAATYFGLKYEFKDGNHYLQCVVDV